MLWSGLAYSILFLFLFYTIILFFFRLFYVNLFNKINFFFLFSRLVLSFTLFLLFLTLLALYFLFDFFSTLFWVENEFFCIFENLVSGPSTYCTATYTNLLQVYYFPFIYIFVVITMLSVLFCLSYSYNELTLFTTYCIVILIAGYLLFLTDSLFLFFLSYEMLLIPSFFILYKFAKTRRCIEASYLMFFWTQFGALFLIFSFIYISLISQTSSFSVLSIFQFSQFEINFLFICWIIGFGVKLPIWPFYGWLPKAHVEASTNFSIFLSGVLVKFAFFGLLKCLITVQLEPTFIYTFPFLVVGLVDAVFKLFYQIDLKKLVAYSTVVEMHWLTICILSGQSALLLASFCMLISHALISTNSFLLVDAINRRFKTRLITEISGINFLCPKLFLISLINCLLFLGFPGSLFFIAEFLFFSFFLDLFPLLCLFLFLILYFFAPTFFFRSWLNALFGSSINFQKTIPVDLNAKEVTLFSLLLVLLIWLGLSWQLFLF